VDCMGLMEKENEITQRQVIINHLAYEQLCLETPLNILRMGLFLIKDREPKIIDSTSFYFTFVFTVSCSHLNMYFVHLEIVHL
jgi:hypothetical protein